MFGQLLGIGAGMLGSWMSGRSASRAARSAADAQMRAAQMGIDEQRAAWTDIQQLLSPFSSGGTNAFNSQLDLTGANGAEAQAAALAGLEASPQFTSLLTQGENAIRQNAAATGGLRGGNTQGALMTFRPQLLAQTIDQQFNRLGGLSAMGLNAATNQGQFRTGLASNVANLLTQQGAANAGGMMGQARGRMQQIGALAGGIGAMGGMWRGMPSMPIGFGSSGMGYGTIDPTQAGEGLPY